jgi:predicted transcriptional regulator
LTQRRRRTSSSTGKTPRLQDTIRLSADGLAKVLGDLEARVMQAVWKAEEPVTARQVHELVLQEHDVALLTVVTVLNKLVTKRLLRRAKQAGVFHYRAVLLESEFRQHAARRVVDGILSFGPAAIAASFVDALAENDPAQLAELDRLVRERLKKDRKKS